MHNQDIGKANHFEHIILLKENKPRYQKKFPIPVALGDFLSSFDDDPSLALGFAEDGSILTSGPDPETLTHLAQSALLKALFWSSLRGLTF